MTFSDIISGIVKPIGSYFEKRQEIKAHDRQQERAIQAATVERQIELIKQGLTGDMQWELEQIKNSGWKDEWILGLLSIPLILVFIPKTAPYVLQGFQILEQTPEWYRWLVMLIFTAVYGIRLWRRQADT
jgi:hypothetical protein